MKKLSLLGLGLGMIASLGFTAEMASAQSTLDIVKQRGMLRCQVGFVNAGLLPARRKGRLVW